MNARKLIAGLAVAGLSAGSPKQDTFRRDLEAHRQKRLAALTREDGWLSLVGLHWLAPGENAYGTDPESTVPLPGSGLPARAGVLVLEGTAVRIRPAVAGVTLGAAPVAEQALRADVDGNPDILSAGSLRFHIIRRGDRVGVRVKDLRAPQRLAFKGIPTYAPDRALRVTATFEAYPEPKEVKVPTVLGQTTPMKAPGRVRFKLKGRTLTLEPVVEEGDSELFFIFKDTTCGRGSYGAGRFLYAALPKDGKVVLDFNRAENPPCAFTTFATCPLPPRENWLPVAIPAGEKAVGH